RCGGAHRRREAGECRHDLRSALGDGDDVRRGAARTRLHVKLYQASGLENDCIKPESLISSYQGKGLDMSRIISVITGDIVGSSDAPAGALERTMHLLS